MLFDADADATFCFTTDCHGCSWRKKEKSPLLPGASWTPGCRCAAPPLMLLTLGALTDCCCACAQDKEAAEARLARLQVEHLDVVQRLMDYQSSESTQVGSRSQLLGYRHFKSCAAAHVLIIHPDGPHTATSRRVGQRPRSSNSTSGNCRSSTTKHASSQLWRALRLSLRSCGRFCARRHSLEAMFGGPWWCTQAHATCQLWRHTRPRILPIVYLAGHGGRGPHHPRACVRARARLCAAPIS